MARQVARRGPTAPVETTPEPERTTTSLPATTPDYLKDYKGPKGTEDLGADDVATPRLVLMQALSPELEEQDNLKAGDMFHSGAEMNLGQSVEVIMLGVFRGYTLWRPRPTGGILARSHDGVTWDRTGKWTDIKLRNGPSVTWEIRDKRVIASGLAEWGSSNPADPDSQPAAVLSYNIPVMFPDYLADDVGPAVMRFQRAGIKAAKKLLGRLKAQPHPIWALRMPLTSVQEQGPEGPYWAWKVGKFVTILDSSLAYQARDLFNAFAVKGVVLKDDDDPDEDELGLDSDISF